MSDSANTSLTMKTSMHPRQRLFYLDWIRALAALLIVVTHFNNPYLESTRYFVNRPFGIYIGSLGVSLFLIISGAALMYTYGEREHLDVKHFYYKRAKSLYPMFWVAFICANIFLFFRNGGHLFIPRHRSTIILSLFGLDGYASAFGLGTFYTLGEWFLGFIILFYLVFPLMRIGVQKHPILITVVVLVLYVATIIAFKLWPVSGLPVDILLTTRLPELLFGMLFVRFMKHVPTWLAAICGVVLVAQQCFHFLKDNIAVTVVGIAAFLFLAWFGELLRSFVFIREVVEWISKYSYPIFLVHHVVIMQVFTFIVPQSLNRWSAYGLLLAEFVVISLLSVGLQYGTKKLVSGFNHIVSRVRA